MADQAGIGVGEDAAEVVFGQAFQLDPDGQAALQFGQQVAGLGDVESAGCDEQHMVRLHRAVFGGDRGAFDQGEQVALHAFAGDAAAAHVTHRDLIHLIQEHDAVGFGIAHGFTLDILIIEALVRLFGQQRLPGGVHLHLAALGAAAHRLGHHV